MSKILITFGCSWTRGVGAGYSKVYQSTDKNDYKSKCWDWPLNEPCSYRSLLCKKYNLENINFSQGGASNQNQFRLSEEFFTSEKFDILKNENDIYVLWAITSTARGEFYINDLNKFKNIMYNPRKTKNDLECKLSTLIVNNFYNHNAELGVLNIRMKHWNKYFQALGIKNIWIDTFNHHNYPDPVDNLCFKDDIPRDLLSKITKNKLYTNKVYHLSDWLDDCIVTENAIENKLLNPYSKHPTSKGHEIIADILSPEIEKLIGS